MTRFGHKLNYVINTFVKHTPGSQPTTYLQITPIANIYLSIFTMGTERSLENMQTLYV